MIPNYRVRRRGPKLKPGMTLAIEPMINMGTWAVEWLDDDWTVVTGDGEYSAHYENTVLITDGEPEILTAAGFYEGSVTVEARGEEGAEDTAAVHRIGRDEVEQP